MELLLFIGVGGLALLFAVLMLSTENAVHSALCLIANFGCVAFIFLMLDAPFLSMVQIAVYAGAIMVLFLFVIMLLKAEQSSDTTSSPTCGALRQ
jgi:NADH-quinone oxidoreductase subunit J